MYLFFKQVQKGEKTMESDLIKEFSDDVILQSVFVKIVVAFSLFASVFN